MSSSDEFRSSAEAFRKARERASVAVTMEAQLLHMAIYDAREAGLSVRDTASALGVVKSTVNRHWRERHRCADVVPTWGSEAAWRDARTAVWSHSPREREDEFVPWSWEGEGVARVVRRIPRGTARQQSSS